MKRPVLVRWLTLAAGLLLLGAVLTLALWGWRHPLPDRREDLRERIALEEEELAQALADFEPVSKGSIEDIGTPAVDVLRSLPGVADVEVRIPVEKPTSRIIHIRDWHFIPQYLLALDVSQAVRRRLSREEIDQAFEQHLLEVERAQVNQLALLRCLVRHHGLKVVFSEGFSPTERENYWKSIDALRVMEVEQVPEIRRQLAAIGTLQQGRADDSAGQAQAIEGDLGALLLSHRQRLLAVGATGRLLISGELEDVLPLEEAPRTEAPRPISPEDRVNIDAKEIEARHDGMVRTIAKAGKPVAVIVLGGSHDLAEAIGRHGQGRVEYLRVTTRGYLENPAPE